MKKSLMGLMITSTVYTPVNNSRKMIGQWEKYLAVGLNHSILDLFKIIVLAKFSYLPQQPKEGHEVHWPSLPRLKR